jgi:nucleoside 2-deoxyribosyltransferase
LDVKRCDLLLAYLPTESRGTISEIGWAFGMEKPIIIISSIKDVREHPVLMGQTPWIFDPQQKGFGEAMMVIRGLFEVYL